MSVSESLITTPVVGLEEVQRAAFYTFFENFNSVLSEVESYWTDRDVEFDVRTGSSFAPTSLEPIAASNFYEGHHPSLILNNPDNYPNLSVFATQATPSGDSNQYDQLDVWLDNLLVEIMVKGPDENTVNRRIQRTTEAAMISIRHNPDLGGAVMGLENAPTVIIGDLFAMKSIGVQGGYQGQAGNPTVPYLWQGAQIKYQVKKTSPLPPPIGSIFSKASTTDYSQYIDQG